MSKKGLRYYIMIFIYGILGVALLFVISALRGAEISTAQIVSYFPIPFAFVFFVFIFDRLFMLIFPKNEKKQADAYNLFLVNSTEHLKTTGNYDIEDFKRFRSNEKFQRALKVLYKIETNGETDDANYKMIEKRFKKDTKEYNAIQSLISKK